jgi:hypothetical protein
VVAPITLLPALVASWTPSNQNLKSPCAQVLLGQLEGESKVSTRGRPVLSLSTGKAAKLSTRAVGSVMEIGGPVTSVAAVKRQCLDTELNESLPGGKGGVVSCEDESSSNQVD